MITLPDRAKPVPDAAAAFPGVADPRVRDALMQIRAADPSFELESFTAGAKAAFEMIVEAYAAGERDALRPLLADDVFGGFSAAIDQRSAAGQSLETQLIAVHKAEVVDAALSGSDARVTVRFASEQVNVLKGPDGSIIEGDPSSAEEVIDIWTFERDTGSPDPNWVLVETRAS